MDGSLLHSAVFPTHLPWCPAPQIAPKMRSAGDLLHCDLPINLDILFSHHETLTLLAQEYISGRASKEGVCREKHVGLFAFLDVCSCSQLHRLQRRWFIGNDKPPSPADLGSIQRYSTPLHPNRCGSRLHRHCIWNLEYWSLVVRFLREPRRLRILSNC